MPGLLSKFQVTFYCLIYLLFQKLTKTCKREAKLESRPLQAVIFQRGETDDGAKTDASNCEYPQERTL